MQDVYAMLSVYFIVLVAHKQFGLAVWHCTIHSPSLVLEKSHYKCCNPPTLQGTVNTYVTRGTHINPAVHVAWINIIIIMGKMESYPHKSCIGLQLYITKIQSP